MAHVKERRKENGRKKKDPRNRPVTAGKHAVCSMHEGEAGRCVPHFPAPCSFLLCFCRSIYNEGQANANLQKLSIWADTWTVCFERMATATLPPELADRTFLKHRLSRLLAHRVCGMKEGFQERKV